METFAPLVYNSEQKANTTPCVRPESEILEVPLMHPTSESQSRYLSLAIACRQLIIALRRYQEGGTVDRKFQESLQGFLEALRETSDENNLFGPMPTDSPFTRYEQVMTLKEVIADFKDKEIPQKLSKVLVMPSQDVKEPIDFFYTLENRALHHYNSGLLSRDS
jgi:hypothetical protein